MEKTGVERVSCTDSTSETDREIKPIYRKNPKAIWKQLLSYILYILSFLAISNNCEICISCEKISNGRQIYKKPAVTLQHTCLMDILKYLDKIYIFKCEFFNW